MAKSTTQYICSQCASIVSRWMGKCEQCGAWNSLVEETIAKPASFLKSQSGVNAAEPVKLSRLDVASQPRVPTGIGEVDRVLGGGIVPGAMMLLSGDPGIGKSTLVLQIAAALAPTQKVLYVSGEESASQIKLRAERLGLGQANIDVLAETNIDVVVVTMERGGYPFVIIDSIQTMATGALTGSPGTVGQITAATQIIQNTAKRLHVATLIIGHVTKEGAIAGPKILEHLVDVVLYLEGEKYGSFKALRGIKNRFGSTSEVGIFEMADIGLVPVTNPSAALLAERRPGPGSVVFVAMEGARPILVEVQALVSQSSFGYPKRTAVGFDPNRLGLLVAVLTRRAGLNLNASDIYVNVVGGLRVSEPAADLAIILSIASAHLDTSVANDVVVFGEVGLSGEIRSVSQTAHRLTEAKTMGFSRAIGPAFGSVQGTKGVATVSAAITAACGSPKTAQ